MAKIWAQSEQLSALAHYPKFGYFRHRLLNNKLDMEKIWL